MNIKKIIFLVFLFSISLFTFFGEANVCCAACCCSCDNKEIIAKYDKLSLEELRKSLEDKKKERDAFISKSYESGIRAMTMIVGKTICIVFWINELTKKGFQIDELFKEIDKPAELVIKELVNWKKEYDKAEEKQYDLDDEIQAITYLIDECENQ